MKWLKFILILACTVITDIVIFEILNMILEALGKDLGDAPLLKWGILTAVFIGSFIGYMTLFDSVFNGED